MNRKLVYPDGTNAASSTGASCAMGAMSAAAGSGSLGEVDIVEFSSLQQHAGATLGFVDAFVAIGHAEWQSPAADPSPHVVIALPGSASSATVKTTTAYLRTRIIVCYPSVGRPTPESGDLYHADIQLLFFGPNPRADAFILAKHTGCHSIVGSNLLISRCGISLLSGTVPLFCNEIGGDGLPYLRRPLAHRGHRSASYGVSDCAKRVCGLRSAIRIEGLVQFRAHRGPRESHIGGHIVCFYNV